MPAFNQEFRALQQCNMRVEDSPSSTLSSTLVIADPNAHWLAVQKDLLRELANFGEIARIDASMAPILRMINITFFDVRAANTACTYLAGRAEQLPPTGDDFRIVLVNMGPFEEKLGAGCNFSQFGEVASLSTYGASVIVEYYDIRGAMLLVAAAGGSASPCTPQRLAQHALVHSRNEAPPSLDLWEALRPKTLSLAPPPGLETVESKRRASPSEPASPTVSELGLVTPMRHRSSDVSTVHKQNSDGKVEEAQKTVNRPVRTKVSSRDFSKFDVDADKIARGEDQRTTVMVRNLVGPRARKDFLKLLEKCGLADRYTFFYMPCKEHRDVPAGFAFVNLNAPSDVLKLFTVVKKDLWRTQIRDLQVKPLALSYARFQGHEELMAHFSSSVVLCEQDPDKRPLFCNPKKATTALEAFSPLSKASTASGANDEKNCSSEGEGSQVSASAPWVGA
uniref:Mei2-like C-terminal RNA recognition motif domain-containing protein n=1 Tax=Strombidinopsis acuminata TaxID=141414 RepID=A0A7S3WDC3_9SPIT|mmetsp:Transcript_28156/g.38115  ORF Transcript_28156/g.38115 Transcript_28156/m.38115 type:complete len:451 (+) Transcript_28156:81-1433(+)